MRKLSLDNSKYNLRLPDFLVIGPPRTGTTWLHHVLRATPGVYVPTCKQVHYFDKNHKMGIKWYASFFFEAGIDDKIGEITPDYVTDKQTLRRIKETVPNIKLIMISRNPIERAYSHYRIRARMGEYGAKTFAEVFEEDSYLLPNSLYYIHLRNVLELFHAEKVLVLDYNSMKIDPEGALSEVYKHIGGGQIPQHAVHEKYSESLPMSRVAIVDHMMVSIRNTIKNILYKLEDSQIEVYLKRVYKFIRKLNSANEKITPLEIHEDSINKLNLDQTRFLQLVIESRIKYWYIKEQVKE